MIVTLSLPLSAADFPDSPEILIAHVALSLSVGVLPYLGGLTGRDRRFRLLLTQRVITCSQVIRPVGADLLNLSREVRENIGEGFGITQVIGARLSTQDVERRLINTEEVKYFSTMAEGAASYARQAHRAFGDGPFTIVGTQIPANLVNSTMRVTVDGGINTVTVPTQLLLQLNRPRIWNVTPLPRK